MRLTSSAFAASIVLAAMADAPSPQPAGSAIDIVASNWAFTPSKITLHAGQPATLRFTSREGVHGVGSDALGIPKTALLPGKAVTLTATPSKTGTYTVPCTIVCGAGHDKMLLTVDVQS